MIREVVGSGSSLADGDCVKARESAAPALRRCPADERKRAPGSTKALRGGVSSTVAAYDLAQRSRSGALSARSTVWRKDVASRNVGGVGTGRTKVSRKEEREILALRRAGVSTAEIARRLGRHRSTVHPICRRAQIAELLRDDVRYVHNDLFLKPAIYTLAQLFYRSYVSHILLA